MLVSAEQIREAYALQSALYYARKFGPQFGFIPDPWQERVLEDTSQNIILNCSRQAGKTHIVSWYASHFAETNANTTTMCVSASHRQAKLLMAKIKAIIKASTLGNEIVSDTANELKLSNGSTIVVVPSSGETIRGYSVHLLLLDESAFVDDSVYLAIRPMLAITKGKIFIMSTPYGRRGHFYDIWTSGDPLWTRIEVPATECPRMSAEFLESERRALGESRFMQEYMCKFIETDDQVFSNEVIDRAFAERFDEDKFDDLTEDDMEGEPLTNWTAA